MFNDIMKSLENIRSSSDSNKDEMYENLYEKYEDELEFVGASAIEDLLQDNVPETIEMLMKANIRVWVLTGDKQETAIEIAKSCKLIQEKMETVILSVDMKELENIRGIAPEEAANKRKTLEDKFKKDLNGKLQDNINKYIDSIEERENPKLIFKKDLKDIKTKPITLVIDGLTLALILGDEELEKKFLSLGFYSESVV